MNYNGLLQDAPAAQRLRKAAWSSRYFVRDIVGYGPRVVQIFPSTAAACYDAGKDATRDWEVVGMDGEIYGVWADCYKMAADAVPDVFGIAVRSLRETGVLLPNQRREMATA